MGRQEGSDPLVLHSSIALLQERFRQLQRIKEMREERELLRVLTKAEGTGQPARCEPFFHPDLILPSRPLHGSLAHRPQHLLQHEDYRHMEMLKLTRLWPDRATIRSTNNTQDDTDVDTSLHL